nr:MAG: hypothetical protein [Bacteriophage sp.]
MTRRLNDIPLETIAVEHYLFDLAYPIEKVSEIFDMDEDSVRKIYRDYERSTLLTRSIK